MIIFASEHKKDNFYLRTYMRLLPSFHINGLIILLFILFTPYVAKGTPLHEHPDLKTLDSCIAAKQQTDARYEQHIAGMKQQLVYAKTDHKKRSQLLYDIMEAYFSYQFDSTLVYVKKCYNEAEAYHDTRAATDILIYKARLLAYGGFYNNAEELLKSIGDDRLTDDGLRYDYAIAAYWTYVFWSAFTMDNEFSERMDSLRMNYLNMAIRYAERGSAQWYYLMGERSYFLDEPPTTSIKWYNEALRRTDTYGRLYSQTTFAIARAYRQLHRTDMYQRFIILSAQSDALSSLKENAALQDLAMSLFDRDHDNATLAHHYLMVAMDDATFFNNKLRKLEISNRLPPIVNAYQQQIQSQDRKQLIFIIAVVILAVGSFVLYLFSRRRNAQLHLSQKLLEHKNAQMKAANGKLHDANEELSRLNGLLKESNRKREEYLRIFVDICASTMHRINSYRNLVRLKIKANQVKDLLRTMNSDRIATADLTKFQLQFDKAFLGLYPNFVSELSKLMEPGYKVELNKDGTMTTSLRIFAFIRLGVTESSEIATLLSYSPHTIYNYRSAIKSHAIDKEHFEDNVRELCKQ